MDKKSDLIFEKQLIFFVKPFEIAGREDNLKISIETSPHCAVLENPGSVKKIQGYAIMVTKPEYGMITDERKKGPATDSAIEPVRRQFETWRRTKKDYDRISENLWQAAVDSAKTHFP